MSALRCLKIVYSSRVPVLVERCLERCENNGKGAFEFTSHESSVKWISIIIISRSLTEDIIGFHYISFIAPPLPWTQRLQRGLSFPSQICIGTQLSAQYPALDGVQLFRQGLCFGPILYLSSRVWPLSIAGVNISWLHTKVLYLSLRKLPLCI